MYFNDEMKPGMRGYIKDTIWAGFVYGAAALVFGIFAVAAPVGTLSVFVGAIGFLLLSHGLLLAVSAVMGIRKDRLWYTGLISGLLQLGLGMFIITRHGEISNAALMFSTVAIGLIGVFTGTYNLITSIRYRDIVKNVWPQTIRGGLLFIIGVSMLLAPFGFGTAMVRTIGIVSLIFGLLQIWTLINLIKEMKV